MLRGAARGVSGRKGRAGARGGALIYNNFCEHVHRFGMTRSVQPIDFPSGLRSRRREAGKWQGVNENGGQILRREALRGFRVQRNAEAFLYGLQGAMET